MRRGGRGRGGRVGEVLAEEAALVSVRVADHRPDDVERLGHGLALPVDEEARVVAHSERLHQVAGDGEQGGAELAVGGGASGEAGEEEMVKGGAHRGRGVAIVLATPLS